MQKISPAGANSLRLRTASRATAGDGSRDDLHGAHPQACPHGPVSDHIDAGQSG